MKKLFVFVLCALLTLTSGSAARSPRRFQAEFLSLFDTVTTVVGYAGSREEFTALAGDVRGMLLEYHRLYDAYTAYDGLCNIKTINDSAGKAAVAVDPRIIDLLELSRQKYDMTGGAVNVALGAVTKIWRDCREAGISDPERAALPSMDALRAASVHTDIGDVVVDRAGGTVFLRDPELRLDVGAVGKGYAVEQTARALEQRGVRRLLISAGGNVRAIGSKLDASGRETPWIVSVADPDKSSGRKELLSVRCTGEAVVTSGGSERYYTVNGASYHHIINPETLMPARYYRSVTLFSQDSGLADGLTTALFNLPLSRGQVLVRKLGVEALWVLADGAAVKRPVWTAGS